MAQMHTSGGLECQHVRLRGISLPGCPGPWRCSGAFGVHLSVVGFKWRRGRRGCLRLGCTLQLVKSLAPHSSDLLWGTFNKHQLHTISLQLPVASTPNSPSSTEAAQVKVPARLEVRLHGASCRGDLHFPRGSTTKLCPRDPAPLPARYCFHPPRSKGLRRASTGHEASCEIALTAPV